MKLSFSTLGCPAWDLGQIADKAREYGFDGVELRAKGRQHVDIDMDLAERKSIRKLFEDKGLEICCLAGYSRFSCATASELEENKELLLKYIELAADLGAPLVRSFIGKRPEGMTEEQIAINTASYVGKCVSKAESLGVTIVLETHDDFNTGARISSLVDRIGSGAVAALWDIHHPLNGGETVTETWGKLGARTGHIHIKDFVRNAGSGDKLCMIGKGNAPIKELVCLTRDKGYKGYYSLEWEKTWVKELEEPEEAFSAYVSYMRGI